jgi:hypothetical protein
MFGSVLVFLIRPLDQLPAEWSESSHCQSRCDWDTYATTRITGFAFDQQTILRKAEDL